MAKYLLTDGEYAVLQEILIILQVAHQAQQLVSSERTPTLSIALPAYELLLQSWRNLCVQLPHFSHYIGRGIAKIEEYVHLSRRSRIYVYAMGVCNHILSHAIIQMTKVSLVSLTVLNPNVKMKWIEQNWTRKQAEDAHTWMLEAVRNVVEVGVYLPGQQVADIISHRCWTSVVLNVRHRTGLSHALNRRFSLSFPALKLRHTVLPLYTTWSLPRQLCGARCRCPDCKFHQSLRRHLPSQTYSLVLLTPSLKTGILLAVSSPRIFGNAKIDASLKVLICITTGL